MKSLKGRERKFIQQKKEKVMKNSFLKSFSQQNDGDEGSDEIPLKFICTQNKYRRIKKSAEEN